MVNAVNTLPVAGQVRQPRGIVKINGAAMLGWVDWTVNNNTHHQADTFRITFALSALPAGFGADWWASQTSIAVEIFGGVPPDPVNYTDSQLKSWIYGNVDEIEFDPVAGHVLVTGRDLTALLIDTKTTEKWANQTSAQIATTLATRHGLTASVAATTVRAGTYFTETAQMNDSRSEWDLLTFLAAKEDFIVYVSGQTLYFQPKPDAATVTPYALNWVPAGANSAIPQFNGKTVNFRRNLTVAKGVVVIVKSTQHKKNGQAITATFPKGAKATTAGTSGSKVQVYYITNQDNLTQQKADELAANRHREITRHEMKLSATLPADDLLTGQSVISVTGTGSTFDQTYFPDSVERRMSMEEGYSMTVTAKNHNTDSETLA
jgi:phage protein D